jgi:hypothetical protein
MLVVATLLGQLGSVFAQSNSLVISPRKDYTLRPGESVSDTLGIANRDPSSPLRLKLSVVDFTSEDETGAPDLLEDTSERTAWSLRDYITLPEQVEIGPGGSAQVPITIEIPADAGAGSYYSAIEYAALGEEADDRVNISASSITLVFVNVPGQAKQQLTFEQFGAFRTDDGGGTGSFAGLFFNSRPKVMAYRLTNEGNVAENPNTSIIIRNFTGSEVYTIADANPKNQIALRGQTRRFDACIAPESVKQTIATGDEVDTVVCGETNFAPGRYTAELSVVYGENGNETREITAKATFWYLPWWFVGLVVLGISIIAGGVVYIVKRVQEYRGRKTRRF